MTRNCRHSAAALCAALLAFSAVNSRAENEERTSAVAAIERALAQPIELRAENRPLVELLRDVAAGRGITIVVDRVALEEAGVAADMPVRVALPAISLEAALRLILREYGLAFTIRDDVLLVTSAEAAEAIVETRVYPVGNLLTAEGASTMYSASGPTPTSSLESLLETVAGTVQRSSWDEIGGPGSIRESRASLSLVVSQTRDVHQEIARLLADLRAAKAAGGLPDEAAVADAPDAAAHIRATLEEAVSIACDGQPLDELLADIAGDAGIPLVFDRPSIEEAGAVPEAMVTCKLDDIRLRSALNVILGEQGVDWFIRDEVLLITSREAADSYEVVRVYPVADLVTFVGVEGEMGYDYESLIELITSIIAPQNWPEDGSSIQICEPSMALVLAQTPRVHEEIARLLADLRAARDGQAELVAAASAPLVDNAELVVRVYHVRGAGAGWANAQQVPPPPAPPAGWEQDLAAAIEALVEPHTWQAASGEGTIRALPGALIVQQTRPMHRQVASLISLFESGRSWPWGAAELTPLPAADGQSEHGE